MQKEHVYRLTNNINLCSVAKCRHCLCWSLNQVSLAHKFNTLSININVYSLNIIIISSKNIIHLTLKYCSSPSKETCVVNSCGVSSSLRRCSADDLFHPLEYLLTDTGFTSLCKIWVLWKINLIFPTDQANVRKKFKLIYR